MLSLEFETGGDDMPTDPSLIEEPDYNVTSHLNYSGAVDALEEIHKTFDL